MSTESTKFECNDCGIPCFIDINSQVVYTKDMKIPKFCPIDGKETKWERK